MLLDDFADPHAWVAQGSVAAPIKEGDGLRFDLPFHREVKRAVWDYDLNVDVSSFTSLQLDVEVPRASGVKKFGVFLRSGNGWYVWSKSLRQSGRQDVLMLKSDFKIEGTPAGWHQIERVRLSPWKGGAESVPMIVRRLTARRDMIALLDSTELYGSEEERALSRRINVRLKDWLLDEGITHRHLGEKGLKAADLKGIKLLILGYTQRLSDSTWPMIRSFLDQGGRVIVFGSADPRLAQKMGVRLEKYVPSGEQNLFTAFQFNQDTPSLIPEKIQQRSWGIVPVFPASKRASVQAVWCRGDGQMTRYPAWVSSSEGWWMSHIPLGDDTGKKRKMMVSLLAQFVPEVWEWAARRQMLDLGKVNGVSSYQQVRVRLPEEDMKRADHLVRTAGELFQATRYPQVLAVGRSLYDFLSEALVGSAPGRAGEHRGVWDASGTGWYPGDWDRTCRELKAHGVTEIYPRMLTAGAANYPSAVLPSSYLYRQHGDLLQECLTAAHRHGLKVHVWMMCWKLESGPASFKKQMEASGRLQKNDQGDFIPWLNPAVPENIEHQLRAVREILERYPVDGIHLDYIRYPSIKTCFSDASKKRFSEWLGREPVGWPQAAMRGALRDTYRRFRVDQINLFVRSVHREVKKLKPDVVLSGAVFGAWPGCRNTVAQNWIKWLKAGEMDYVVPMNYMSDTSQFMALLKKQKRDAVGATRIRPGIGVTSTQRPARAGSGSWRRFRRFVRWISPGLVFYQMDATLRDATLPVLRRSVFRPVP